MSIIKLSFLTTPLAYIKALGVPAVSARLAAGGGTDRYFAKKIKNSLPFVGRRATQEKILATASHIVHRVRDNHLRYDTTHPVAATIEGITGNIGNSIKAFGFDKPPESTSIPSRITNKIISKLLIDNKGKYRINQIDKWSNRLVKYDKNITQKISNNKVLIPVAGGTYEGYKESKDHDNHKKLRFATGFVKGSLAGSAIPLTNAIIKNKLKPATDMAKIYREDSYWRNRLINANKLDRLPRFISKIYTSPHTDVERRLANSDKVESGIGKVTGQVSNLIGKLQKKIKPGKVKDFFKYYSPDEN